jgi:hypothetical protein
MSNMSTEQTKYNAALNFVLFFVVLVGTLFVSDLLIKATLKIPSNYLKEIVRFEPLLSPAKRLQANLNKSFTGAFREFEFHVSTDSEGFRISPPFNNSSPEILILGDSQTFGIGVRDDQTFASKLSQHLNVSVLNTGCPGYNTHEELLLASSLLDSKKPKTLILAFFAGNDPFENYKNQNSFAPQPSIKTQRKNVLAQLKDFLVSNSSIYNCLINLRRFKAMNSLLLKFGLLSDIRPAELSIFEIGTHPQKEAHWKITDEALLKIKELADHNGISLFIVFIPDRYQVDDAYWSQWVKKYSLDEVVYDRLEPNRHMKAFSERHDIPFVDPTFKMIKTQKTMPTYWRIDNHLNPTGHEVIADSLFEFIKEGQQR